MVARGEGFAQPLECTPFVIVPSPEGANKESPRATILHLPALSRCV
jgi:hypothetical protein